MSTQLILSHNLQRIVTLLEAERINYFISPLDVPYPTSCFIKFDNSDIDMFVQTSPYIAGADFVQTFLITRTTDVLCIPSLNYGDNIVLNHPQLETFIDHLHDVLLVTVNRNWSEIDGSFIVLHNSNNSVSLESTFDVQHFRSRTNSTDSIDTPSSSYIPPSNSWCGNIT